jgi:uncharacterized protein (UPF0335 family)
MTHMNRSQRRAAKAKEKVVKLDRVVAVHEAGHAVARFLVADDFGRPPEEMIGYIEVGLRHPVGGRLFNKSVTMVAQATTFGATFSAELQSVIARTAAVTDRKTITNDEIRDAFTVARSEGIDVDRWLKARMLIMTLASGAEAMHTGRSIHEVWTSPESESDQRDAFQDGYRAGLADGQIEHFVCEALERSEELIRQETVQRAIKALADAIPDRGRMTGCQAAFIVNQVLQASTVPGFTAGGF